ncbi:hypothetical protein [Catenuloplanes atrovinosus]|uniref:Uncharacterized protein n=1 Tax=Catenuloplanes atrovinosus TaxID=137266 RepID=A0AAE4C8L1_9ACTN|nr:hypothetical protein [Catenuloplanes atrovinosus]MDR7275098.1 hypothetical protein [Catenuloplanes atrovinosus]
MTSTDSLVHDTPATRDGKTGTGRVGQAVAAAPEAARRTGAALRRNPAPVAAAALLLAGAAAAVLRMRAMSAKPAPLTRTQRVRAAVTSLPSRVGRPALFGRAAATPGRTVRFGGR